MDIPQTAELELTPGQPPVAPVRQAPPFWFLASALAGGNVVSSVLRAVGGVLQAHYVLPPVLGLFNGLGLVLGYAPFLQLGILNGLNRELPYYIGKGEHQRVRELAAAAQAWALLLSGVIAGGLLCAAAWSFACGNVQIAVGWVTYAVSTFFLFYGMSYLQTTYRTGHDFARLAMVNVVQNAVALALVVLVALLSFYGLCLRAVISGAVGTLMLHYWRPVHVGPKWNFAHWKHLLIIGLPIFGVGQLYAWWTVLDSTLVLGYMGDNGMGLYAMVVMAVSTLELLPLAVSQVVYPRMAERYGRTGRMEGLLGMTVKPVILTAAGMLLIVPAAWWLVGPLTRILVPNYVAAVPAIQWSLWVPFLGSFMPMNNIFNVAKRQGLYLMAILAGMGSYVAALLWLVRGQADLTAFPKAMIVGRLVFIVSCFAAQMFLVSRGRGAPQGPKAVGTSDAAL
jgi:O-antigen/teichoic acid export membrane protein